ncbi:tail protein [Staphylococcus phage Huma]|nr:tail protein [Staphylococcus phage Huma]
MAYNENDFKYFDDIRPFIDEIYKTRERYTPFYDDRADYNTNSKSYYDYLSKLSRLIEVLARRIWEYDDELKKRFKNWDDLMKAFPEQAKDLFRGWLNDGTIDNIIHDEFTKYSAGLTSAFALFKVAEMKQMNDFKAEVKDLIKDIDRFVNGFELNELEPKFVMGFGGIRNAVNQSINIDKETNHMYSTQSDSQTPEGFWINKLTPSGDLISSMRIVQGGHGTTIGLERQSNGEMKIWLHHDGVAKLLQVAYKDNYVLDLEEAKGLTDYTPQSLLNKHSFTPLIDEANDKLILRFGDGTIQVRSRADVKNHIDNVEKEMTIDNSENNDNRWMQGIAVDGDDLYWLSGNSSVNSHVQIGKYSLTTGQKIYDYPFKLSYQDGINFPRDNFKEPEGICIYTNPKTKRKSLLLAMTNGGGGKRFNNLYGFFQLGEYEHFEALRARGAQNYKLTKDDGRALSIPDHIDDLNDLTQAGFYYIDGGTAEKLKNMPTNGSKRIIDAGCFINVYPTTQTLGTVQELTRFSTGRKMVKMIRGMTLDVFTLKWNYGLWSTIKTDAPHQEYLEASQYNNWIAYVTTPGEYYITGNQMELFRDAPDEIKKVGAWLRVSSGNAVGEVRQTLEANISEYKEFFSNVNAETKHREYNWVAKHQK